MCHMITLGKFVKLWGTHFISSSNRQDKEQRIRLLLDPILDIAPLRLFQNVLSHIFDTHIFLRKDSLNVMEIADFIVLHRKRKSLRNIHTVFPKYLLPNLLSPNTTIKIQYLRCSFLPSVSSWSWKAHPCAKTHQIILLSSTQSVLKWKPYQLRFVNCCLLK